MEAIRHMALGCCVISTLAGMIRVFWPENTFAPVINAVLALYIITAGLQMLRTTDWQGLTAQLYSLSAATAQQADYADYGAAVAQETSAEAVRSVLQQAGVEAAVTLQDGLCRVELVHSSDADRARALLASACGDLPWEIIGGGEAP